METRFSAAQLRDPEIRTASRVLEACVHYGFCTATCPTYVLSGDENESPRGRIDLIKAMLEKGGSPDPKTVRHIDQCLSCLACETTCAAKVEYGALMDVARHHVERTYRRPWRQRLVRGLLANVLPYPRRSAALARLAAVGRRLAPVLPGQIRAMLDLTPARAPRRAPQGGQVFRTTAPRQGHVALLAGCVQQVFEDEINQATIHVLNRIGFDVHVAAGTGCCGALPQHMGRREQAIGLAAQSVAAWTAIDRREPLAAVIANASGCGTTLKEYGALLQDHALAAEAGRIQAMAMDISEFLAQRKELPFDRVPPLTLAYHDPCSLQHGQRVTEPPRRLLEKAGYRVRNIPEGHFCCGSAGTYNMLQPQTARTLGMRKAQKAESTAAQLIATGNLGCIAQLRQYTALPVLHTIQMLAWAMGGPQPPALAGMEPQEAATEAIAPGQETEAFW